MERDGLAPTLIMATGLQRPKVPQAATDAYPVTRGSTSRSSRIGETCKGDPSLTDCLIGIGIDASAYLGEPSSATQIQFFSKLDAYLSRTPASSPSYYLPGPISFLFSRLLEYASTEPPAHL
jgi:hypothetical protein